MKFRTRFSRPLWGLAPRFLHHRVSPETPYIAYRGCRGRGSNMGVSPQKVNFCGISLFSISRTPISFAVRRMVVMGVPFTHKNFGQNRNSRFREKGVQRFWGRGTFFGSTPWGVRSLDLTLDYYGPGDPDTCGFCCGGIGPHLGELGGFEIFATPV